MNQECQSLRLSQSQLRETLEESQNQVGVHDGQWLGLSWEESQHSLALTEPCQDWSGQRGYWAALRLHSWWALTRPETEVEPSPGLVDPEQSMGRASVYAQGKEADKQCFWLHHLQNRRAKESCE